MNIQNKPKIINILLWLASVGSMIGLMIAGSNFLEEDQKGLLIEFSVITAVTLIFLFLISGKKTFSCLFHKLGYTLKTLLPVLIFPAIFLFMGLISLVMERPALKPDWLSNNALLVLNMFLVGVYEEGCFRACACDALLPAFKKLKHPFFLTALISSLVFGYVHVVSVDFTDLQQVLQFILKIATTALFGATFMVVYWKTRNLLGLAIIHGLHDLLPEFLSEMFVWNHGSENTSYTSGDSGTTIVYVVQLVFSIAVFVHVYRKVRKQLDFEKTAQEW